MRRVGFVLVALVAAATVSSAQVGSLINYGAIIKDSLRLEGTHVRLPSNGQLRWGEDPTTSPWIGTLQSGTLSGNRTWTLPDESGTLLSSSTTFGAASGSDATVSGTYNTLDIQLKAGVVGTSELADGAVTSAKIADGTIVNADISSSAAIAVSKLSVTQNNLVVGNATNQGSLLAPPSGSGQVLTWTGSGIAWQSVSGTVPNGTADGQLLRWNGTSSAWEAVGLSAGAGISITNTSSGITITNAGDTDPSNDLTTSTTFGAASGSDATVSGTYNALDIQLKPGVVGTSELANGAVTSAKIDDGTIVDADISSSAAIAVSKLSVTQNNLVVGDASNQGSLLAPRRQEVDRC